MALQIDLHVNGTDLGNVAITRRQQPGDSGFARYRWNADMVDGRTAHGQVAHRPEDGAWTLLERVCREVQSAFPPGENP